MLFDYAVIQKLYLMCVGDRLTCEAVECVLELLWPVLSIRSWDGVDLIATLYQRHQRVLEWVLIG